MKRQWVIIDSKVYNLSRFKDLHPGGISVLLDEEIGKSIIELTPLSPYNHSVFVLSQEDVT